MARARSGVRSHVGRARHWMGWKRLPRIEVGRGKTPGAQNRGRSEESASRARSTGERIRYGRSTLPRSISGGRSADGSPSRMFQSPGDTRWSKTPAAALPALTPQLVRVCRRRHGPSRSGHAALAGRDRPARDRELLDDRPRHSWSVPSTRGGCLPSGSRATSIDRGCRAAAGPDARTSARRRIHRR